MANSVVVSGLLFLLLSAFPTIAQNVFNVTVGGRTGPNGSVPVIAFSPPFLITEPGDQVVIFFSQGNHTLSQSTFDKPCELMEGGFDSGFTPVADNNTAGPLPAIRFVVQDSNPKWFFCRQIQHCASGMVFAFNPQNQSMWEAFVNGTSNSTSAPSSTPSPPLGGLGPQDPPTIVTRAVSSSDGIKTITYSSYPGSAAPTAPMSADHLVMVGGLDELTFVPSLLMAQPGDTITFQFTRNNHSVTQSSFDNPCQSLTRTSTTGEIGFNSGFIALGDASTTPVNYTIQVNDTNPMWVSCAQKAPNHCRSGMVFAANTIESGPANFAAFQRRALQLNSSGDQTPNISTSASTSMPTMSLSSHSDRSSTPSSLIAIVIIVMLVIMIV